MNKNDIKKVLYKEKPIATEFGNISGGGDAPGDGHVYYVTKTSVGEVTFKIPDSEVTDEFEEEIPAQLLIRWIHEF